MRGAADDKLYFVTPELVYADDTMLIASSQEAAQRHFDCVAEAGQAHGLAKPGQNDLDVNTRWWPNSWL